ncbi:hypothetical protein [Pseudoalteromonas ulvae]|uniref:Uncharacterized protein n=1 Tax=Pseudoalteromonas ulvae TaxID=107327 RepID=A0A244CUD8_PSEDV|nr:hypothetical protein [Pseudoalteromonas ulvae]OUL59227.1 hypothetical protein B1199_02880 [Pseudoalteromonas ulvae]
MRPAKQNIIIGGQYNNLTVVAVTDRKASNGQLFYTCRCTCGSVRDVQKSNIGKVIGCGCVRNISKRTGTTPKPRSSTSKTQKIAQKLIKKEQANHATPKNNTAKFDDEHYDNSHELDLLNIKQQNERLTNRVKTRVRRKIEEIKDELRLKREQNTLERELNQLLKGC